MEEFFRRLEPILQEIRAIQRRHLDGFVHCSKLNHLAEAICAVPSLIDEEREQKKKRKVSGKTDAAVDTIVSLLVRVDTLALACVRDACVPFVLKQSVKTVKHDIKSIRGALVVAFGTLGMPAIAAKFKISRSELKSQDQVDMKRISHILGHIARQDRRDAADYLAQRFKSLKKTGVKCGAGEVMSLAVPDLPPNLHLVVQHKDVNLGKRIGGGKFGDVFIGDMNGRSVAVKVLHQRSFTPGELDLCQRELFVLATLDHHSLIQLRGYTEEPPFLMVTDLMERGSLFDVLRKDPGSLDATARSVIAMDIAQGLAHLHERGVIHRDMKSLNVLIGSNNRAKICDFGMVRLTNKGIKTGMVGTVQWMAPELIMSRPSYDSKVDVYSFGLVLWELLTSQMPYSKVAIEDVVRLIVVEKGRPEIPEGTPSCISSLITRCWDDNPVHRPSMGQVVALLSRRDHHMFGTDEVIFESETGVAESRHVVRGSHQVDRRGKKKGAGDKQESIDLLDAETLLQLIAETGKDYRGAFLRPLCSLLPDKTEAEIIAAHGGCHLIAAALDERSVTSNYVLSCLVRCKAPQIFDVVVLKALLAYVDCDSDAIGDMALCTLIMASDVRFDFLRSSPSFLLQVTGFLNRTLQPQLAGSLLQLCRRFLVALDTIPSGISTKLLRVRELHSDQVGSMIVGCLAVSLARSAEERQDIPRDLFVAMVSDFTMFKAAISGFASGERRCTRDGLFCSVLWSMRTDPEVMEFVTSTLVPNPRFGDVIAELLPFQGKIQDAARLYRQLLHYPNNAGKCAILSEFYACVEFFVTNGEYELVREALKSCRVNPDMVTQSKICSSIVKAFGTAVKQNNEAHMIFLMGAIYSIAMVMHSDDFLALLQPLYIILSSGAASVQGPAFLTIIAIGSHASGIDYGKLLCGAMRYVTSSTPMLREAAADVIQKHMSLAKAELPELLAEFVKHYRPVPDDDPTIPITALVTAAKECPVLNANLLERLMEIHHDVVHSHCKY